MGMQTPINITPALAAQLVQITGGQADRAAEILQALTTLSDNTGADLTTLLNDIAAVKGDTAAALIDADAIQGDVTAILADTTAIRGKAAFPVSRVLNNLETNGTLVSETFFTSSADWVVAHSYNGSGILQQLEVYANYALNIFIDDNHVVHYPGNAGSPSSKYKIINGDTPGTYLQPLFFESSLRVEIMRVGNSTYTNTMKVLKLS